jgi:hypothetical protein
VAIEVMWLSKTKTKYKLTNLQTNKQQTTRVGTAAARDPPQNIVLSSEDIEDEHAIFESRTVLDEKCASF